MLIAGVWFATWRRETTEPLRVEVVFHGSEILGPGAVIAVSTHTPSGSSADVAKLVRAIARIEPGGKSIDPVSAAEVVGASVVLKGQARVRIQMFGAIELWRTTHPPESLVWVPHHGHAVVARISAGAFIDESSDSAAHVLKLGPVSLRGNMLEFEQASARDN